MADYDELIDVLKEAVSLEYTAAIQYTQHSVLVTGRDRAILRELFETHAKEALAHAKLWGERIVHLGGVPPAEVNTVHQSTDATEMLEMDLELEKKAVETYSRAHAVCKHPPTRFLLESHIVDEDKDVEELQKLLGKVRLVEMTAPVEKVVSFGRR